MLWDSIYYISFASFLNFLILDFLDFFSLRSFILLLNLKSFIKNLGLLWLNALVKDFVIDYINLNYLDFHFFAKNFQIFLWHYVDNKIY